MRPARLVQHPPYRRAVVILLVAFGMASLFVVSYVDALGRPSARAIDVAVVGATPDGDRFTAALQSSAARGLRLTRYPDESAAFAAVDDQRAYAVVSADAGRPVRLVLSTASGSSVARVLSQAVSDAEDTSGIRARVTDRHPLPATDPSGLAVFYLTIAATILGFVTTFQLRANAKPLPLRPWLAFTAALVVLGSLVLTVLVTEVLGVLPLPLAEGWGVLALQMTTASAVAAALSVLVGRWALVPTWLLFVVLGNTSSGGAVSPALLPEPFSALSRWLPSGATVSALRGAAYFRSGQRAEPLVVLACWAVAAVTALVVVSVVRGRSPGED